MRDLTPSGSAAAAQLDALDAAALRARIEKAVTGSYEIEKEIGRGGMAVVYSARDLKLRRIVALKVLPPDLAFRADVRARFVREAQTAAGLNHPNIVPIYAVDERDGMVFFAMSLINGETLATRLIREPRPPVAFVESILVQVADALAYAHQSGVVHRDIKPDNVLIDAETGRATVTDFGIARALEGGSRLTQTGIAVGTPAFMSPEQATGEREIDGRSDVYSLGILGYLMLAGRLPFEAASTPAMLMKHVSERPHPLRQYRPDAPSALVAIIERCLAKAPNDRWANAGELRDAVRGAAAGTSAGTRHAPAAPPPAVPQMPGLRTVVPPAGMRPTNVGANAPREKRTDAEWREQYPQGKRAEDWNPPNPAHAESRMLAMNMFHRNPPDALNAMPTRTDGSKRDFREWRREMKMQRAEGREMWKAERDLYAMENGLTRSDANIALTSPDKLIHRFRGHVLRTGVILSFLGFINVAQRNGEPWVVFPAFGMAMFLITRYSKLRENGISFGEILRGESDKTKAAISAEDPNSRVGQIARIARKFRTHARWAATMATISAASLIIGASFNEDAMLVPFFGAGALAAINSLRAFWFDRRKLKNLGISMSEAWSERWQAKAIPADTRPRDVRLKDRAEQLVGASVLASSLGSYVRSAVEDHATIKETSAKLSEADRVLVPDVDSTADALLERISAIAGSLERLERDLPEDAMNGLAERIKAVEAESQNAPDRERRISLLTRQLTSLQDLVQRKETLQRQLESASMALRSLRLDMVKLSALGMGALGDVTNATQEARAVSKDIARALYAADEVRKL